MTFSSAACSSRSCSRTAGRRVVVDSVVAALVLRLLRCFFRRCSGLFASEFRVLNRLFFLRFTGRRHFFRQKFLPLHQLFFGFDQLGVRSFAFGECLGFPGAPSYFVDGALFRELRLFLCG